MGLTSLFLQLVFVAHVSSWNEDSVLLREVQALILQRGRFTTGRRSRSVPQLQCVGGSAGCSTFTPDTVQCSNQGWDGLDVQWECRADMDSAYRFGRLEVSCEGFSHPDDPYILKGSCGLEYTLELTQNHRSKPGSAGGWSGFASSFFSGSGHRGAGQQGSHGSGQGAESGGLLGVAVLLLLAFAVYKLFLAAPTGNHGDPGNQGDGSQQPPPPGFRPDFTESSSGFPGSTGYHGDPGYQGASAGYGFHSDYTRPRFPGGRAGAGAGSGFWTGMGTGGVLGYLFGSQRRQGHQGYQGYGTPHSNSSYSAPHHGNPAPSTRTASGFAGTKRR